MSCGGRSSSSAHGTLTAQSDLEKEKNLGGTSTSLSHLEGPIGPPDGGRDAWMTVAGTWMIQFCTYGYSSAFGVYQDFYTRDYLKNQTPSDISWIGSFQLFMMYAPGILVGNLFDRGYFHHMVAVGSILQVFSMFMLSLTQRGQYYQIFLAQAVGMGLGQSLLFLPSVSIIGQHFKNRRALATGIAVSGASVGGIIWPIMLNKLGQRAVFANGIRATASMTAALLLIANLMVKTRPFVRPQGSQPHRPDFKSIVSDTAYTVSVASAFCISLGLFFPFFYLQLYAVDKGISKELAFYAVAILNSGSVMGRLLPNFFADKFGPYNMIIPCLAISSILAFSMFGIGDFPGVTVFGILYGFWSGSYVSLIPSLLAQLTTNMAEIGTRMGIAFSIAGVSLLIGTPIEGALLHAHDGSYAWYRSIILCGVMTMCGAVGMVISRFLFVRRGGGGERGQRV
ncbi:major facilitator superfamily domain-containing protein [Crucibulum laeve]|uniref:Major facilitator superfamily domain-containing protein n=1 Tax=Crucibulum laeve TaxID=68775 RepID=A0A5C3LFI7_9AGAR|nr:major facilitator superfamily domain-containing protein [Crucibulum laeve]